jgi:MFS family permease
MRCLAGPLASRNFRLLLACDVVSVLGTAVAQVAVPFAVLAIGGSAADVSFVAAAAAVPVVVFLLWGGVAADRFPRHTVMVTADVVQALAQAASAALMLTGQARVWELITLAALRGLGLGFYLPAAQGLLPQTVPGGQLSQANAVDRTGRNSALIAGSGLGGLLVGWAGPGWGLLIDGASFALAAALRTGMRFPALPTEHLAGMASQLREGWREFVSRRWLWATVLAFTLIVAISLATVNVIGPLVAQARLGGAHSWGAILASDSAGAVLGGLAMIGFRPKRMLLTAVLSVPAFASFLFALAVPLSVPLLVTTAFLMGGCLEVFGVNWATTMQQEIPAAVLSRVSAYDALGSYALAPLATLIAGPLAAAIGTSTLLTIGGAATLLLTATVLCLPEVRRLQRRQPPPNKTGARPATSVNPGPHLM